LLDFVNIELLPGTGVTKENFWSGLDKYAHEIAPKNKKLLEFRENLQKKIDIWHRDKKGEKIVTLDDIERELDPGPPEDEPYAAECPMLPATLASALDALDGSQLFRREFGDLFINYLIKLKNSEVTRFNLYCTENKIGPASNDVTEWEQNEYFDFF